MATCVATQNLHPFRALSLMSTIAYHRNAYHSLSKINIILIKFLDLYLGKSLTKRF